MSFLPLRENRQNEEVSTGFLVLICFYLSFLYICMRVALLRSLIVMNRIVLFFFFLLCVQYLTAQSLPINGNVVINGDTPEGAKVTVNKNGKKLEELSITKKGRFDLKLALGADYKVTFSKAGYITKIVTINTEVPEESIEANPNFPPVKLIINLFPHTEDVDLSIFDQPIAILIYNPELDDFTFDKEYAEKIKNRIAQTEQEIRRQLATKGPAAMEKERQFAALVNKGQQAFTHKEWNLAIGFWEEALQIKPENDELKQQIAAARQEMEREASQKAIELQNEEAYRLLLAEADSLFNNKRYNKAKEKYKSAVQQNAKDAYPASQIREIDSILSALAKQESAKQKQEEEKNAAYQKAILLANQAFNGKEYTKAIHACQQALDIKANEAYPKELIAKAEQAIAELKRQEALDAEQKRLEQEKKNQLKGQYDLFIAKADSAFRTENYALAKMHYANADRLNLNETYPKEQIGKIDKIINSSQYRTKLTEYNKNKALGESNMQQKNYAGAKVYFQKALSILPIDKESIERQIAEIDRLIEESRLAEIEKVYKENIEKADKAYQEKAYAVARFYYKKALETKTGDKHASDRLNEVEKLIGERQSKETEL